MGTMSNPSSLVELTFIYVTQYSMLKPKKESGKKTREYLSITLGLEEHIGLQHTDAMPELISSFASSNDSRGRHGVTAT
jgi:hypothetical protein